jgi:shikimate dehydrogenase
VTIPYKEAIIPFLDSLSPEAEKIGAVNTILFSAGKKTGYNTDAWGFEHSLVPKLLPQHGSALVLGTGGASKAVVYVLDKLGIHWQYVSRRKSSNCICYDDLAAEDILTHPLIINTTPLGMFPNTEAMPPLPYEAITAHHFLYDLVYNPAVTRFMQQGIDRGARVKNGLEMLQLQADRAWEIWNSN